jgi:hypothetical protein
MNESMLAPVMNKDTNPTLEFRDGQCLFKMVSLAGTVIERFVSWESVREAALNIPVDSGWLAPEVVRWGNGRHGEWAVAFIPPGRHLLELEMGTPGESEQIERVTAPLPGMVMFCVALKYFVWAVKTEQLNPYHEIYRAPLPNVMQDASVCWGPLKPPQAGPKTILKGWELFIRSTFNNHAANGKSKAQPEDVRKLLKGLAGGCGYHCDEPVGHVDHKEPAESYPVEDLVRQVERTGVTLDAAIREFWVDGEMPG